MSGPSHMIASLDTALAEYTAGIDRAVRFVTIDQVDMLAEFYLHNRRTPDPAQIRADALREAVGKYVIDPQQPAVGSIWRHLKSGHIYHVIACGLIESNLTPSVIYTNVNPDSDPLSAANWVRPMVDFCDGRFALLATQISPTAVDTSPAPDAGGKEGV